MEAHAHRPEPVRPIRYPSLDVGQIFRDHGERYLATHTLSDVQGKALRAISDCRTAALGGHLDVCVACGHERPSYNSCRNRHCPKCQGIAQMEWLEGRRERILPIPHFHLVFTLPEQLRGLCQVNPRLLYNLLFDCGTQSLMELAHSRLGVQLGLTAVLHTWTRELLYHPHLHCVVTAGGLDDGGQWKDTGSRFLLSVKALGKLFRGKFLDALRHIYDAGALDLSGPCAPLAARKGFKKLLRQLYAVNWVVYCKAPFATADHVYQYLGQYTHRVGIANSRLLHVDDESVRFRTRGRDHVTVTPEQFIGRMLQHVLPFRFVKIRHYGLLAPSNVHTRLETARTQIAAILPVPPRPTPVAPPLSWRERITALTGVDPMVCPQCHGPLVRYELARPNPLKRARLESRDTS